MLPDRLDGSPSSPHDIVAAEWLCFGFRWSAASGAGDTFRRHAVPPGLP